MNRLPRFPLRAVVLLLLSALISGCGSGLYPVNGRVTYEDGSPVPGGTVIGEAQVEGKMVSAQGAIARDGTFSWGTTSRGDGAWPGSYRVVIMPRALGESERAQGMVPAVASKYTRYESSGIAFEVKAGKNQLNIVVSRPGEVTEGD